MCVVTYERALAKLEGLCILMHQASERLCAVGDAYRNGTATCAQVDAADNEYTTLRERVAKGSAYMMTNWPVRFGAVEV